MPLAPVGSGVELAENPMVAAQSPGFNQFPSGGSNLPVWMAAGDDGLEVVPGSLGAAFGNGLFSSSTSTGG